LHKQICHHAGMSAIAVWKGVNPDQPVMQSHGCLIWLEGCVVAPVSYVIDQLSGLDSDPVRCDADILFCAAVRSCPLPDIPEHFSVQSESKVDCEHVAAPVAECPSRPCIDIVLFG